MFPLVFCSDILIHLFTSQDHSDVDANVAILSSYFNNLANIDADEYEILMRLLVLIGSYGSLTLWQIVNWLQCHSDNVDQFISKRVIYKYLTLLCAFGAIKQVDFSYTPTYVHGVVNNQKTLIANHKIKSYHAYFLTNVGMQLAKLYLKKFAVNFNNNNNIDIDSKLLLFELQSVDYCHNFSWKEQILNCWLMFNWQHQLQTSGLANLLILPKLAIKLSATTATVNYRFGWRSSNTFYEVNTIFPSNAQDSYDQFDTPTLDFINFQSFKDVYGTDLFMNQQRNVDKHLFSYEMYDKQLILVHQDDYINNISEELRKYDSCYDSLLDNLLVGNYYFSSKWIAPKIRFLTNGTDYETMMNEHHFFIPVKNESVVDKYQNELKLVNSSLYNMDDLTILDE